MSTCVSAHGEYSEHERGDDFRCTLCGVLDEEALIARVQHAEAEARRLGIGPLRTAEAERDHLRDIATSEVAAHETQVARIAAERDEARGKLDKVREACKAVRSQGDLEVLDVRVLAILDGRE